jgi:hypothetical protein
VKKQQILVIITVLFAVSIATSDAIDSDWLITHVKEPAKIEKHLDGRAIILSNSLIAGLCAFGQMQLPSAMIT